MEKKYDIVEAIRESDREIDEKNVNTEKLPEYAQKIIAEFIGKYYSYQVGSLNFSTVFSEFADSIRPHLSPPFLPVQKRHNKESS